MLSRDTRMTADEARTFDRFSIYNFQALKDSLVNRNPDCSCEPYEDCFTIPRWNAQGYRVNKGERAHRLGTIVNRTKTIEENGQQVEKHFRLPKTAFVFCRCQVSPSQRGNK